MICATLPALGYWRPTNGAPGYVPSLLSASWSQILLFAKPLPIHLPSHHFCLSTSSEQFRIFGLVSYKRYVCSPINWLECSFRMRSVCQPHFQICIDLLVSDLRKFGCHATSSKFQGQFSSGLWSWSTTHGGLLSVFMPSVTSLTSLTLLTPF